MSRCTRTLSLEVHHIARNGGTTLENAQVLCPWCHAATPSFGVPGTASSAVTREIKEKALRRAGHRCECTRTSSCH
jgi:hypothetical protein